MIQKLKDIHFTSNIHFRNKEAAIARGFDNVEAMEDSIINQWNTQVKPDDTVYILGGFCSIAKGALQSYMNLVYELNGHKHFVLSSDDAIDTFNQMLSDKNLGIETVSQYKEIMFLKQKIVLMHYPMLEWPGMCGVRGSVHLHGGKLDSQVNIKRINVSYDKEMKLYTAEDILHSITRK
jgi:calcineurin-like phosphoesterase family protein